MTEELALGGFYALTFQVSTMKHRFHRTSNSRLFHQWDRFWIVPCDLIQLDCSIRCECALFVDREPRGWNTGTGTGTGPGPCTLYARITFRPIAIHNEHEESQVMVSSKPMIRQSTISVVASRGADQRLIHDEWMERAGDPQSPVLSWRRMAVTSELGPGRTWEKLLGPCKSSFLQAPPT